MKKYMNINNVVTSMRDARRAIVRGINAQSEIEQLDCAYTASARYFEVLYALSRGLDGYDPSDINNAFLNLTLAEYQYENVKILKLVVIEKMSTDPEEAGIGVVNPCIAIYGLEKSILNQIDIEAEVRRITMVSEMMNKSKDKLVWDKDRFDFDMNKNKDRGNR